MKKYLIFLLLIFIFSNAVSAQDLNQISMDDVGEIHADDSNILSDSLDKSFLNLEKIISAATDDEKRNNDSTSATDAGNLTVDCANQNPTGCIKESNLGINDDSSFSALFNAINQSDEELNLSHDYKFNESIDSLIVDYSGSIIINKDNLTINGNNNVIDGAGIGATFNFKNYKGRIVINDLTFKNFNKAVLKSLGFLTLNNVNVTGVIIPNTEIIRVSQLMASNCNFHSNKAKNIIFGQYSDVTINNSRFSGNDNYGSAILVNRNRLIISNSVFENFTYKNGAIIDFKGHCLEFINSRFINAYSNLSGGAIIAKYFPNSSPDSSPFLIKNCVLANLSCGNDGGAIYIDLDSGSQFSKKTMDIVDSNFTNCRSKFGGAIAILGGTLNINHSNFINNSANYEGGAIYSSWTNLTISKSDFKSNAAGKNAGAICFDKGRLTVNQSNITENNAFSESSISANAIYAHDVDVYFTNSNFDNGGLSVYADFAGDSVMENVEKNNDIFLMDNHNYIVHVENKGIKLNLTNNEIIVDKLPSRFDARDWGWTTPARLQGDSFDCWAFATVAAIETAIGKSAGALYNLSENYVSNLHLKYYNAGDLRISATGFSYSGLGYSLSWYGVLPADDPYDDRGFIMDAEMDIERIHVQDAVFIYTGMNDTVDQLKRAILKYGAVAIQCWVSEPREKIPTEGEDIAIADHGTHFVTLIGWDDDVGGALIKGAWIAKDSSLGINEGLYYTNLEEIDYYAIVPQRVAIAYVFENSIDYHVNYQTDITGLTGFDSNYTLYSNEFTSKYNDLIGAVGTYFNESGINYSFDVFVNGVKTYTQSGVSEFAGFRTIILDRYIPIKAGDQFKVVFKSNSVPYQAFSRLHYKQAMSFISKDGSSWEDFSFLNKTVCLKIYTIKDNRTIISNNLTKYYKNASQFIAKFLNADGEPIENAIATFNINGISYQRKITNGTAKLNINLAKGNYTITSSNPNTGEIVSNNVEVLSTIKGDDITKFFKNATQYYATFLDDNGNPLAEGSATFNINGVFYERKITNGTAKLNINLQPGIYTIASYHPINNETHANEVKVLPIIKADDLTKKYGNSTPFEVYVVNGTANHDFDDYKVELNNIADYFSKINVTNITDFDANTTLEELSLLTNLLSKMRELIPSNMQHILRDIDDVQNAIDVLTSHIKAIDNETGPDYINLPVARLSETLSILAIDFDSATAAGASLANACVTFNINGVFYNRTTLDDGIAKLNINLLPGKYIITSMYNDAVISNTVTILSA